MNRYNLKYKTFDELMAEVKMDFEDYNLEDHIKPFTLIKVAKRVNYDLGLRIHKTENVILEVEKGRAKLPDDFYLLNYAYLLGHFKMKEALPQGTHTEQVPLAVPAYITQPDKIDICATPDPCPTPEPECPDPCAPEEADTCSTTKGCQTWMNCKGETMQLIQKIKFQTRTWDEFYRIRVTGDDKFFDPKCPNLNWLAKNKAFIRDGYIYTSFQEGDLYINYEAMMKDSDGNLLVLNHPMINEYYEYALKERILENLMAANHQLNPNFVQRIDAKFRMSRNVANGIVNTMEFTELEEVWRANRKAMYNKYYKMFV
jgi:hypothetical protein